MNTRVQAYGISPTGINSVDVYEDISTRSLNTVRIGQSAGKINSGSYNVYAGYQAGANAANSSYTTAIGYNAMFASTDSLYCTAIGAYAAAQNKTGSENVYVGYRCGELANNGNQSVAVGAYSMNQNVAANGSVAIGYRSAERTLDGGFCVFIGAQAGQDNRNSLYSTMAGYQSGRASRGDENCLFGAYSGYSNINGNGSCLFGYRSGEFTSGDYNCAFGAYCMQNASGSCNVAIGAFANSSGFNSANSVFVGTNVASTGSASESVILGTNAGATAIGSGLIILGYNAGAGFINGNNNILIGKGATTLTSTNYNGIAIGSINTFTYNNSISVGNDITNANNYSILMGHALQSDATQSIVLGNNISIKSVNLFQDPLSYLYIKAVTTDGISKIGLTSINYCNILISPAPENNIYTIAQASIYASNIVNSENKPPSNGIASTKYNLLTDIPSIVNNGYAIITGECFPIRASHQLTSNIFLSPLPTLSNITPNFYGISNTILNNVLFIDYIKNTFIYNTPNSNVTVNIRHFNASNIDTYTYIPKTIAPPILNYGSNYQSNIVINKSPLKILGIGNTENVDINTSSLFINYDSNYGLVLPTNYTNTSIIINSYPLYGELSKNNNNYIYTPFIESTFAKTDSMQFISLLNITSNTGLSTNCAYGLPSSNSAKYNLVFNSSNEIYKANTILAPILNNQIILNNQTIQSITNYNSSLSNIVITHISSNQSLFYKPTGVSYSYDDIYTMSNNSIWNYTNNTYNYYLQNILTNINACLTSNTNINTNILNPLINTMTSRIPNMSNQILIDDDINETTYYNIFYNDFTVFSNIQTPSTLNSLTNTFNNLYNYNNNLLQQYNSFNEFNNDLISYNNIYINDGFYYMNSNILITSNIVQYDINMQRTYINSLPYLYNYTSNSIPTYTNYNYALELSSSITNLHNIYLQIPRLYLSYHDFNNNNIILNDVVINDGVNNDGINDYLELTISNDILNTNNANNAINSINSINTIKIPFSTSSSSSIWNILHIGFTCNIASSNTTLIPISLNLPNSSLISNFIIQELPSNGVINNNNIINNNNNNYNNYIYNPINPWATNDVLGIVVTSNNNSNYAFANYTFNYDNSVRIQSPLYIQTPPSQNIITDIYTTINNTYNVFSYACNIDIIASYTINGINNTNLLTTQYTPITYYDPNIGAYKATSNIEITYNTTIDIITTEDGQITITSNIYNRNTYDNINFNTSATYDTNIYSWTVTNPLNYNVSSNMYVYYTYTSCNTVYNEIQNIYNYTYTYINSNIYNDKNYDTITDTYIYSTVSSNINTDINTYTYPYSITSNTDFNNGMIANTTSNIILNSNISYYDTYVKLNTNNIWTLDSTKIFNVLNYSSVNSPVIYINNGPINSFNMNDILNNNIYIHIKNNNLTNTIAPFNIQLNSYTLNINPVFTPETSVSITQLPTETLNISSSNSCALLNDTINYAATQILSFSASHIHLYSFNNKHGSFVLSNNDSSLVLTNNISISQLNKLNYLASHKYTNDTLMFFFTNNDYTVASQLFSIHLNINFTPFTYIQQSPNIICGQSWNTGITYYNTQYLSSNALYYSFDGINPIDIIYDIDINTKPSWLTLYKNSQLITTFTQDDINNNHIYSIIDITNAQLQQNSIINDNIQFTITKNGNNDGSIYTFPISVYNYNSYPNDILLQNSSIRILAINNVSYNIKLLGEFWNIINNLKVAGVPLLSQNITIYVKSLNNGFLWSKSAVTNILTSFTLDYLLNNEIRYIPFNPNINELNNDILTFYISYDTTTISELYSIKLEPYITRFSHGSQINTGINDITLRTIKNPIYSAACVANNVYWDFNSSNTISKTVSSNCLYNSNINIKWNLSYDSSVTYTQTINTVSYSYPINIINSNINLVLDQCYNIILNPILNCISCNINNIYDCYIYITKNPSYGVIQNIITGTNVTRCSINDLYTNNIVYQHFGGLQTVDTFSIGVSSTPYDFNLQQININVQINPLPLIQKNNSTFLYFNTASDALNSNIIISNNDLLVTNGLNNSKIHIITSCNIDLYNTIFTNNVNFYINSNIVTRGAPYDIMSFDYIVNNNSANTFNPLTTLVPYKTLFYNRHEILLNYHITSNIILPGQNHLQSINYTIDPSTNALKNNHTLTLSLDVWPSYSLMTNQTKLLHTHEFNISINDINNHNLLFADFHKTYIKIKDSYSNSNVIKLTPEQELLETTWNNITIINLDPLNNNGISLQWYDGTNLLDGYYLNPIINSNIASVNINFDTTNTENYIASSNFTVPVLTNIGNDNIYDGTMGATYNLYNYYTKQQLKNFQLLQSTYDINDINIIDTTVNNVVLGNQLTVRGINNICIGDTFSTSGRNSIIIGNKIGSLNSGEIYESIVIGNNCFQDSTLRDLICIGRNNLNKLSLEDPVKVQNFIAQFPIIIGNNISSSMLDFYINIDNTFLKTTTVKNGVNVSQIYLGFENEPIGIGYTNNMNISQDYALNINGTVLTKNIISPLSMIATGTSNSITPVAIPSNYLVSSTGNVDTNDNLLVQMAGINGSFDSNIMGIATGNNSLGETIVSISGNAFIWCDTHVICGQYLVCSSNNIGIASASSTNIKNNCVFGKSLVNWNPTQTNLYPNISTKTIDTIYGRVILGKISCIISL